LLEAWHTYNDFSVGRYVILPNHIHLLVGDSDVASYSLDRWVGAWKAYVSRRRGYSPPIFRIPQFICYGLMNDLG